MQQLVGHDIGSYTFDPANGNITFVGVSPTLAQILLIVNKTVGNQLLYTHLGTPEQSGSLSGAVLHLASACHGMHSTDVLQIYIDAPVTVTPIGGTVIAEGYVWSTSLLDWVPMQQPILNAGSVTIPGTVTVEGMTSLTTKYAEKIQIVGDYVYEAKAIIGSLEASAVWQASRTYTVDPIKVTWADGDSLFNNVATNLSTLTYS